MGCEESPEKEKIPALVSEFGRRCISVKLEWLGTGSNCRPHDLQSRARTN